jgi:hypothetical protein
MDRASPITRRVGPRAGAQEISRTGCLHTWVSLLVVLACLLGSPLRSGAHIDPPAPLSVDQPSPYEDGVLHPWLPSAQPVSPATPGPPLIIMVFALMAIAITRGLRKRPRAAAVVLVLALCTFTFGVAVHSVHHLSEPGKAAECPVLSAAQHVPGALTDPSDIYAPVLAVTGDLLGNGAAPISVPSLRPNQQRAPPSSPA